MRRVSGDSPMWEKLQNLDFPGIVCYTFTNNQVMICPGGS